MKILNGPFTNVEGTVGELNDSEQKATIITIMFGRETSTEIGYGDLEKVEY